MKKLLSSRNSIIRVPSFQMRYKNLLFRSIRNREELMEVYRLTYNCYLQKGYCDENENRSLIHYPQYDALKETAIFVVENQEKKLVGTISTTKDNPCGLHVDIDFHDELNLVRQEGKSIASSWRIAVDQEFRAQTRVVRLLIDGSVAYWHTSYIDTCLMSFHPHHERFYERYANCKTIGTSEGLKDIHSEAILMRWDAAHCPLRSRLSPAINHYKAEIKGEYNV